MLKYEATANLLDRIRAFDFEPMPKRNDCYVEGMVLEITSERGYKAFKILCEVDYWDGQPMVDEHSRVGKIVFVPLESDCDFDGRVVKLA
jgi:hypothetical protein